MIKHEPAHMGQKIVTATAPDRGHKMDNEKGLLGRKMGGGCENLSHTIPGAKGMKSK